VADPIHITRVTPADDHNQVVRVEGGTWNFQPLPCAQCPWRKDQDGTFPAEAFRISAPTAYDMAVETFGCHMAGVDDPATCAGFLLSAGAQHNLTVRLKLLRRLFAWDLVIDGGHDLHPDYRSMAEANGVDPDDPVLRPCR
jgi:hypothetical protein